MKSAVVVDGVRLDDTVAGVCTGAGSAALGERRWSILSRTSVFVRSDIDSILGSTTNIFACANSIDRRDRWTP